MEYSSKNIRNIAIIAHVDHGKTTLVDQMLSQGGAFDAHKEMEDRVMDNNDLERERGITILSKNTAVNYNGVKINIVDTPGHADFGGEVERILMMVDGVLLLVDAFEGCMPQTRFVLKKALSLGKKPIVVINKIDRPTARATEVLDEVLGLFIDLGADDEQLEFSVIYASARDGHSSIESEETGGNMEPLFKAIVDNIPHPVDNMEEPLQLLISNIDYDDYIGRIGVGRIERGCIRTGDNLVLCKNDGTQIPVKISKLYVFQGLSRIEKDHAVAGDIVALAGISGLFIGETLCDPECVDPLPFIKIDEPTLSMNFMVNDSPFAGREGKFVTSRHIRDRLFKEVETNVSMTVEETETADAFKVSGRGELHLSILIETMRREGYEFQVSRPKVIYKEIDGVLCEPIEYLTVETQEEYVGAVMEKLGARKSEMINMMPSTGGSIKLEFEIPARGLIGYRSEFLTDTKGNGTMGHIFSKYAPYKGEISSRNRGSLVAWEDGETTTYGLFNAQERGKLFIPAGVSVYTGMIVGENAKNEDLVINVCKKKHITNIRASGSDDALRLVAYTNLSLEQSLEFIGDDEFVEVTPKNIRLRKQVLSKDQRAKMNGQK